MNGAPIPPGTEQQVELSFQLAEATLAYARRVLESHLDTAQALISESAATGKVLARDTGQGKAAGALLAQLAQANAEHWSACARRVAEATMQTQTHCMRLLTQLTQHDAAAALFGFGARSTGENHPVQSLLQPLQTLMELLATATRPWLQPSIEPSASQAPADKPEKRRG